MLGYSHEVEVLRVLRCLSAGVADVALVFGYSREVEVLRVLRGLSAGVADVALCLVTHARSTFSGYCVVSVRG